MKDARWHWELVHAERARLAELLGSLAPEQWIAPSLCANWQIRDVAAHLAAAGSTTTARWLVNMARSGFNADRHNERLLRKQLGNSPRQSLENFNRSAIKSIAPLNSVTGLLGEVVVHGQDIAEALDLPLAPERPALRAVAGFFASRDFAVNSKTLVKGLRMSAADDAFSYGDGPEVRGELLDLVLAMAGREQVLPRLQGEGVGELARRITAQARK
ncbi:maleylpyruvate isomerase family mycothiol-dependent enzyme [Glutamicibacter sp.]|uniref:maleylpyruvate isomerase family mycothiol-dependent enzyme n=1 Tax=Glutamicibacter sp. TaxID=1931995 RepID=UPI003D6BE397